MRRFGAQNTACSSAASRVRSLPIASARGSAFSLTVACRRGCCPHAFARSRLFGDRRADYAPSFRARGVWSLSRSGRTSEGGCSASKAASLVQLAIAWGLRLPALTAVLVGAKNPNQVQEHLGGVDLELGPDEISRIERFRSQRLRANQTSLRSHHRGRERLSRAGKRERRRLYVPQTVQDDGFRRDGRRRPRLIRWSTRASAAPGHVDHYQGPVEYDRLP